MSEGKLREAWVDVCDLEQIVPDMGVCCAFDKTQVAVFRVGEGRELYALSNLDPYSGAQVLSRGILGDRDGEPKVASPIYKQNFSLRTGACLDDPEVSVPTFQVRVDHEGVVQLLR